MHGPDSGAHQCTAGSQLRRSDGTLRQYPQGQPRCQQGRQNGQQRQIGGIPDLCGQTEGEHADEMSGPYPTAQREGAGEKCDETIKSVVGSTCDLRRLQGHRGREYRDENRQQHQTRMMAAMHEELMRRRCIKKETGKRHRPVVERPEPPNPGKTSMYDTKLHALYFFETFSFQAFTGTVR